MLTTVKQVEDALFDWTVLATGLAEKNVVWVQQPAIADDRNPTAAGSPQPETRPYVTLQILRSDVLGTRGGDVRHSTPVGPAPAPAPSQVVKMRKGTFIVNAYGELAQDIVELIRSFRDKPTAAPVLPPVTANASITTVAGASLVDGETFTLDDGAGQVVTFEFDDNALLTQGNVAVDITGAPSADVMRDRIVAAIATVSGWPTLLLAGTDGGAATVTLTHLRPGLKGNRAESSDTVADVGFVISVFAGGSDSDVAFGRELGSQDQTTEEDGLFNTRSRLDLEFSYLLREDDSAVGAIEQAQFLGTLDDTTRVIDVDLTQA